MGAQQSTGTAAPTVGYHVLQVTPKSPGDVAGLVSYFDFIVSANDVPLTREDTMLVSILTANIGKDVKLIVYNSRTEQYRETRVIPSSTWGGAGLAGISVRFCAFSVASEQVWHVLNVQDGGPADAAGLQSDTDFIVGTPEIIFQDPEDFYSLIQSRIGKQVSMYVFSTKTDRVRIVTVIPSLEWGGQGCLGCDVAYGFLHRIPGTAGYKNAAAEAENGTKDAVQEQQIAPERAPSPFPIPRPITPRPEFVADASQGTSVIAPVPMTPTSNPPVFVPSRPPSTPSRTATPVVGMNDSSSSIQPAQTDPFKQPVAQTPNRPKIAPMFQSPRFTEAQYLAGAPEFLRQQILQQDEINGL